MRRALGIILLFALQAHSFVHVKPLLSNARCLAVAGRHGASSSLKMQIKNPDEVDQGGYTAKQRLRDETESPFRKARQFLVPWLAGSAALGALISGSRLAAISSGIKGYSLEETATNLALNLLALGGLVLIFVLDKKAEDANLLRIARSGKLSALKVDVAGESGKEATLPVVAFRRSKRVCIVAGGPEVVQVAQEMATVGKEALTAANVVVLPVTLRGVSSLGSEAVRSLRMSAGLEEQAPTATEESGEGFPLSSCLARPVSEGDWVEWVEEEKQRAIEQGRDPALGIVINVEKTGFIKRRSVGVPNWSNLAQVSTKINSVKTGMPTFTAGK